MENVGKEKEPELQLMLMTGDLDTVVSSLVLGSWLTLSGFVN